jgi:hypothetical protein
MVSLFKKILRNKQGNALLIAGAALPLVVGAAGLASDTIQWTLWKRQLQRAADSAAIAGVYTRMKSDTQSAVEAAVDKDLDRDNHVWMGLRSTDFPDVDLLAKDGDMEDRVEVTLEIQQRLPFSSMFMSAAPIIRARATAATVPFGDNYCVIGLDPHGVGIEITGSTDLDFGECSLIANSDNPTKAAYNGNNGNGGSGSKITARSLAAVGQIAYSGQWNIGHYNPSATAVPDDYYALKDQIPASLTSTTSPKCTKQITMTGGAEDRTAIDKTSTDVICITNVAKNGKPSGLTVSGDVKLGKGTYIINGGDLTMNSTGSKLSCAACTVVMSKLGDPTNTGSIKITGGTLDITAPDYVGEPWRGIAFYQDPRAKDDGKTGTNQINGNSNGGVKGVVYFGNQSLLWNGGGNATAMCLQLVAKRVSFSGNSKFQMIGGVDCPYDGMGGDPVIRRVKLVA